MYAQSRATIIIPGTVKDKSVFGARDTVAKDHPSAAAAPSNGRTNDTFGGTTLELVGKVA
jgi:hypothetical protein